MSISVTISGSTYSIPTQSSNPPWGDDLSALLQALVNISNSLSGAGDILPTSFTVANNVAAPTNITGAAWDTSIVRSFIFSYSIYRNSSTTETSECGQIYGTWKSVAGTWELAQTYTGSSGVTFSISAAGQLQYVSSNFGGVSYQGKLRFNAKSFLQA